jgi:hypothetical protein
MRLRATLATLALTVAIAGCGAGHSERPAVTRYIEHVDAIEAQLARPLAAVTGAGSRFAADPGGPGARGDERSLRRALARIEVLRAQLVAIDAPRPAARLRRLIVELTGGEDRMTRELTGLVAFLPPFSRLLATLPAATARLRAALAVNQPLGYGVAGVQAELAAKARALRTYRGALDAVAAELRRLRPPPVSRPQFETQLATLHRMSASAGRVATALTTGAGDLPMLVTAFANAASGADAPSALRAEAAAVRIYDRRIRRLTALAQAVQAERTRLQATVR